MIVECKADTKEHAGPLVGDTSQGHPLRETAAAAAKRCKRFAVDGALHYAKGLPKELNVVSGETKKSSTISTRLWPKGSDRPKVLRTKEGKPIDELIPWCDYIEHATDPLAVESAPMFRAHRLKKPRAPVPP